MGFIVFHFVFFGTKEKSFQNFRKVQQAYAERAKAQKEAQARREAARDQAQAALKETGTLNEGFVLMPERTAPTEVETVEAVAAEVPEDAGSEAQEASELAPDIAEVKLAPEEPEEVQEPQEPVEDPGPFEWSGFKDRCLGRLVAEHRYNFKKAMEADQQITLDSVDPSS